jgi:hypothetical protein
MERNAELGISFQIPADLQLALTCRGDANRCGMALLLKALAYLGYVPEKLDCMPSEVALDG